MKHKQLKQDALKIKAVKKEYDKLSVEVGVLRQLLAARKKQG